MAPLLCGAISATALEPPTPPLLPLLIKPPKLIKNWAKQNSVIKKIKIFLLFALAELVWFYLNLLSVQEFLAIVTITIKKVYI